MTESTRADQIEHLANRLRALLDDCWDAGVQVLHHPEPDGECCQGDYLLRAREEDGGKRTLSWMPLVEKWALMPPGWSSGSGRMRDEPDPAAEYGGDLTAPLCCCKRGLMCAACGSGEHWQCPDRDDQDDEPGTAGGWYCNNSNCDCRDESDEDD